MKPLPIKPNLHRLLKDREYLLDTLVSNLKGMVYCCLLDEYWTMVFVSEGCQNLTGFSADELLLNHTTNYEELIVADDRQRIRECIENAVTAKEHFDLEYRITQKNGNVIWVRESGCPIYDEQSEFIALEGFIQEISRQKQSEQAALDAEDRYRSIFENAIEGIYQTSPSGQYLNFNPALARIYGYDSPSDLVRGILDIQKQLYVDPNKRAEFIELMSKHSEVRNFEAQVYRKNGEIIWISENAHEVYDADGHLRFYEGTVEDISERKKYERLIEYQAKHDSLTGLPNRSMLPDRLQEYMVYAKQHQQKLAVAFIDLDQFKFINDSMGHHIGDQLLIIMAERLKSCIRSYDTVVRLGGDEFVLLLSKLDKIEDITHNMERVLSAISSPCTIEDKDFVISCSIGIAIYPDDGIKSNTLLKHADSAMYKAKELGRNNFQFYTRKLNTALTKRMEIELRLRRALKLDEFILHYQPKIDFRTGKICGAEALIRWQRPGEGLITPMKFIPIAEETGQIEEIGNWVLQTACQKAVKLKNRLGYPITIAVNVSPRQFRKTDLVNIVNAALQNSGLEPRYLELEITENCLIQDPQHFIQTLHDLKKLGISLAIDDFGTGYSSMAYLKDFPLDRLKIDKVFVGNLETEPTNVAILKAIIALGHGLGLKVVAEGVETSYQKAFLYGIGCDEFQGYLFSEPLSAKGFVDLMNKVNKDTNNPLVAN